MVLDGTLNLKCLHMRFAYEIIIPAGCYIRLDYTGIREKYIHLNRPETLKKILEDIAGCSKQLFPPCFPV
jgi:hypothetical protein